MRPMRRLRTSTVWRKSDEEYVKNKYANHRVPFMPPFLCFGIVFNENLSSNEIKPDYMVYTTKEINGKNAKNSKWILAKYDESLTLKKMVSDVIDENMVGIVTKWINKEAKNLNLPPGRIFAIDVDRYGNKLRYYI